MHELLHIAKEENAITYLLVGLVQLRCNGTFLLSF
jgi:hypothetical protein